MRIEDTGGGGGRALNLYQNDNMRILIICKFHRNIHNGIIRGCS